MFKDKIEITSIDFVKIIDPDTGQVILEKSGNPQRLNQKPKKDNNNG